MAFEPTLWAARYLGPSLLRALSASWRYRELGVDGNPVSTRYRAGSAIYALWHAQLLPLTLRHMDENLAVIISRHRDGEIISRMIIPLGYRPIRGSSTRGGATALREFTEAAADGHPLAITTDGPRGPARRCKPGAIRAASAIGWPIVPSAAVPARAWRFRSWDEFQLPKPGSIVYVTYGDPITVPPGLGKENLQHWQDTVGAAIDAAASICERALTENVGRGEAE